ncbi:uncharacterized protein GBIM_09095 [Gryllus bimaculatus]|nr:uncharacterized protein GBIM_09095 [Gryllus bimaculatus]
MAFKFFALAALLAVAQAGGPAAYSTLTPAVGYGSVGLTQESTVKGTLGAGSISQYSSGVDTAHSSSRVASSRVTNDKEVNEDGSEEVEEEGEAENEEDQEERKVVVEEAEEWEKRRWSGSSGGGGDEV